MFSTCSDSHRERGQKRGMSRKDEQEGKRAWTRWNCWIKNLKQNFMLRLTYKYTCTYIYMHSNAYIHINKVFIILYIQTPVRNLRAKIILFITWYVLCSLLLWKKNDEEYRVLVILQTKNHLVTWKSHLNLMKASSTSNSLYFITYHMLQI